MRTHTYTHAHSKKGCAALRAHPSEFTGPKSKLIPCYEFSHPLNLPAHVEVLPTRDKERERKEGNERRVSGTGDIRWCESTLACVTSHARACAVEGAKNGAVSAGLHKDIY